MEQNFSLLNRLIPHLILNYHSVFDAGISGTDVGSIPLAITDEFYGTLPVDFKSITSYPIGIYQGLTGVAFKLILP